MADQIQLRGGTTAETQTFTGASREVSVDTDRKVLHVHDGVQAGGYPQVSEESLNELRPGENLLLNSNFRIARRVPINGDSQLFDFFNTGILANYGADMWATASSRTMERMFNDTPSYSNSGISLKGAISSGSNSTNAQLRTAVELSSSSQVSASPEFPAGDTFTLSWASKVANGYSWAVNVLFTDGVNTTAIGGDSVNILVQNDVVPGPYTGTGTWDTERQSVSFTIPSAPNSTNTCLEIVFVTDDVTGGDQNVFIQLADVKLERGNVATPYVTPNRIEEIGKTARYCLDNTTGGTSQQTGSVVSPTSAVFMLGALTKMRAQPTFVTASNSPVLQIFSSDGSSETVTPSQLASYGGDIRLVVEKSGGGNLSTGGGSVYLRVFNDYILDASL